MFFVLLACGPLRAVVITEIHYNPGVDLDSLEFVEIASDTTTPEDLSGYRFSGGITYQFPLGTILGKNQKFVVCADGDAVIERYGLDANLVFGNFIGRLDGSGERLELANDVGIPLQSIRYRDEGKWPTASDGTGHSLVIKGIHLDSKEPESWTWSPELGGSPGRSNFPEEEGPRFDEAILVEAGETWRYRRGTQAFSNPPTAWRDTGFDDSGWDSGAPGFGYGDNDDTTVLEDMRRSYSSLAIRKVIELSAEELAAPGDFFLGMLFDDGFCAFVNGRLVASSNCDEALDFEGTATGSHEARDEELFLLPADAFVEGENVVVIAGHNFSLTSSDFSLAPRLLRRSLIVEGEGGRGGLSLNELYRGAEAGTGWVELYNRGAGAFDLAGHRLTDNPARLDAFTFPAGASIAPGGFAVVTEAEGGFDFAATEARLFLLDSEGSCLAASTFDRSAPEAVAAAGWSHQRYPDGAALEWISATPTRAAPNEVAATRDLVINELFYNPPEDRTGEFVELYNRGTEAIDLTGFRFSKGIEYTFESGSMIGPGAYLVIAEEPVQTRERYAIQNVIGPYEGLLADGGENIELVDGWGNPVDRVRYYDGGRWSIWADGRGSSLELIDPRQDNSVASAWEASDESEKAEWEELSYSVSNYQRSGEAELHLFLVEKGACLLDDISVVRTATGANHIANGGFETNTAPWRIQGTHIYSSRVTYDAHSGNACLEVVATGKGDTTVNRLETDTSPRMSNGAHRVSLWARWLRGTSLLIGHSDFTSGAWCCRSGPSANLSGNTLGGKLRLTVPLNLGTPGRENSVRENLREETGSANLGPVISSVSHDPVSPAQGELVSVRARISDSDGISRVRLLYREGSPRGDFSVVDMADESNGEGRFQGRMGGFATRRKVVFYLEAEDEDGAVRRYPRDAPEHTLLLQAAGRVSTNVDASRVILDDVKTSELGSRMLHSNNLLDGAFVFNNDEVMYNVGVRYRGSPWGRPGRNNYRVSFQKDKVFHRGRTAINLTSRGANPAEGAAYFLVGRNGSEATPSPTADYFFVRNYFNGSGGASYGLFQSVDRDYVQKWYGAEGGDGPVLKANGRLNFNDGGSRVAWDGASYRYMGEETENYRGYYFHSMNQTRDDWVPLVNLARVMDRQVTRSATDFDARIGDILDVEAWLRVISVRVLIGGWDAFSIGNGHNGYLSFNSATGLWGILPFDMDNSFGQQNFPLFPTADADVARMMSRPASRRIYYRVLHEFLQGHWSRNGATPWMSALQRDVGLNTGGLLGFISSRAGTVQNQIRSSTTTNFRIRTNNGNDFTTDDTLVRLEGEAPVQVAQLFYSIGDGDLTPLEPEWTTQVRWRFDFDLVAAVNEFQFVGFNTAGELISTTSIVVESTAISGDPRVTAWFPSRGPVGGGFEVTFVGTNLVEGMRVFFGDAEASEITLVSEEELRVIAPRAAPPLPRDQVVDIRVVPPEGEEFVLEDAIEYEGDLGDFFLRGDGNRDNVLDISDGLHTLFHLFRGRPVNCADAADFNDDGELGLSDAIGTLDYLFRSGPPPAAPFPQQGIDLTEDGLECR